MTVKIAPSILSCDFGNLNEEVESVSSADLLHIDIMDGHFVPNISFGSHVLSCIETDLPLDVHLMLTNPEKYIEKFVEIGVNRIYIHAEIDGDVREILQSIIEYGVKPGLVLNIETPVSSVVEYFDVIDAVLVMGVKPGFGGQDFNYEVIEKIMELKNTVPDLKIAVDGGLNGSNCVDVAKAGADILVFGSYIFKSLNRKKVIDDLRNCH